MKLVIKHIGIIGQLSGKFLSQSTHIYRVPQSISLVGIGTLPSTLSPASVPLPPEPCKRGGGHSTSLRVRGWGCPNSDDWRKAYAYSVVPILKDG
jgi:hypothetical protein